MIVLQSVKMNLLDIVKIVAFLLCGRPYKSDAILNLEKYENFERSKKKRKNIWSALIHDPFYIKYDRKKVVKAALRTCKLRACTKPHNFRTQMCSANCGSGPGSNNYIDQVEIDIEENFGKYYIL